MEIRTGTIVDSLMFTLCLSIATCCGQDGIRSTYDNLNRLIRVDYGNDNYIEYSYDEVGNIVRHTSHFEAGKVTSVITTEPNSVTEKSATLTGIVNPSGESTTVWFEWGTSTSYGSSTTPQDIGKGTVPQSMSAELKGLTPATAYHYRAVARNSSGVFYGNDMAFTTGPSSAGQAGNPFVIAMGGSSMDYGRAVAVDSKGNVCVTGYFHGTADFGAAESPFKLHSRGGSDIYVAKYSGTGAPVWAKAMGGASGDSPQGESDAALGVAVDASDNIYLAGHFAGTADFDPGPSTFNLTSQQGQDVFVAKLDSHGNLLWAKAFAGGENDTACDIALDPSGNVYVTGQFAWFLDMDPVPGANHLSSAGGYDIFVISLTSGGTLRWGKALGGAGDDYGLGIAVDNTGNPYVAGYFRGTADFDPSTSVSNLTSAGGADAFVAKLDSGGTLAWAKAMGGPGDDKGQGIAVDASGNVCVTGSFEQTVDVGLGASKKLVSAGGGDVFVAGLNRSGTCTWAIRAGGAGNDVGTDVVFDGTGNPCIVGHFEQTAGFDPALTTATLRASGLSDILVCELTSSGSFVWAKSLGGSGADLGSGIARDSTSNLYVTGCFQQAADFDPGPDAVTVVSRGSADAFLCGLTARGSLLRTGITLPVGFEGFETGDFSRFKWLVSSWTISDAAYAGSYCAKAAKIDHGGQASLTTTLDCTSGVVSFAVKVSSEAGWDLFRFYIDGAQKAQWSGEQGWTRVSYPVGAGKRTFKWAYSKDAGNSAGSDTAWIDDIVLPVQ